MIPDAAWDKDLEKPQGLNGEPCATYSESHRAHGLPDDLLNMLKDDLENQTAGANRG